jgi:phage tail-like protein
MAVKTINERTRAKADPIRNFKFQVQFIHLDNGISTAINKLGFTSIEGLGMSTDVTAYREGGWNTNPHKLPGQTDFPPLTMSSGVFYTKPGMWRLAKQMFAVQWGSGTIGMGGEFRYDLVIRVLDHPVTKGPESGAGRSTKGAVLGFKVYNAWTANVAFGGLNAGDNGVLIHNMTVHHEGLEVLYGPGNI